MPFYVFLLRSYCVFFFSLPGQHGGEEVVWLGHHLAMPRPAQSPPGSKHFTYTIICVRYPFNAICKSDFVVLFCTWNIYCMLVRPGREIPPLWLFPWFLPSTHPPTERVFSQYGKILLTQVEGPRERVSFTVQFVEPSEAMWLWFWAT